jgi:predicted nucleic acid-binding Zn ribbon protein
MATPKKILCPSCGFANQPPLPNNRCVSCGVKIEDLERAVSRQDELQRRFQQEGFSIAWFGISIVVMSVLTAALVMGLPMAFQQLDFEGQGGMVVALSVWFLGGLLIGLISPGKTFVEPAVAALLVAIPTAFLLYRDQAVRTMPAFMYVLLSALGVLFSAIGTYIGERVQMGPPPRASD